MRAWKIAAIVGAVLAGVLLGALLLVWLLFDPNDYKDRLQGAFRDASGRELHLDGPLSLSIFPWLAVELGPASVANREGFGDAPFAALEHARLGLRLWPLLTQRRLEFGPVRIDGLALRLAVAKDGRNNWSDLLNRLNRKSGGATPGPPAGERTDFSVASVALREASLQFADAQAGSHSAIEHWALETGRLQRGTPLELDMHFDAIRNERALGRFELHSRVDLSGADQTEFADTRGKVQWARDGKPALDLDFSLPRLTLAHATRDIAVDALALTVGPARLQATLAIRQGSAGPQVSGRLSLAETSPRALLEALGTTVPATQEASALQRLAGRSKLAYSSARGLVLDDLTLELDDTHLAGRLAVGDFERLPLRFALRGDAIDLDRYLPPHQDAKAAPPPGPKPAPAPGGDDGLRRLDVRGSLSMAKMVVAKVPLENVELELRVQGGQLALEPLRARAFGGTAVTELRYDLAAAVPTLQVDQRLSNVDVAAMLGQLIDVRQLEGRGNAHFSLRTRGADAAALFAQLSGPFDLTVTDGALLGADLWFEIERALSAAQLKKSALTSRGSGRTEFDRLAARGTIANRTLRNDRLEFDTDFAQVRGRGDVDYGRGTLDLDLVAKLLKTPPGRFLGVEVSRVKGADIPLTVTGTLAEPKVRPDVSSLLEAAAKDALKQPLEGKIKEQLEKIFKR
jgi:AsmA protein